MANLSRSTIFQLFILALAVILAFFPGLNSHFIWDDFTYVINYDFVKMPDAISRIWLKGQLIDFWPIAWSLFVYQWRWFGEAPFGYHAFNFGIHILNCWLLLLLLRKLNFKYSFWATLLFAVHPVGVDTVVWMFQSKTTVATLFGLLACYGYLKFDEKQSVKWLSVSLFFFIASLLTKSTLITLPVALVLFELYRGHYDRKSPNSRFLLTRLVPIHLWPFFLVSLVLGLISVFWYPDTKLETLANRTITDIVAHAAVLVFFYPYKLLLPFNLSFVYPDWRASLPWWQLYAPLVALGFLIFAYWRYREHSLVKWFGYCFAGYVALLFPVLGFFRIYYLRYSPSSDHWQYHASMVAMPMILVAIDRASQRFNLRRLDWCLAGLIVFLMVLSFQHSHIYKNEETAWTDTLKKNPTSTLALNNYGILLEGKGKILEAKALYEEVLKHHPNDVEGNTNLGAYYVNANRPDEGIPFLKRAISQKADAQKAIYNLGVAYSQKQLFDLAIAQYITAIKIDPSLVKARNNLGIALYRKLKFSEAANVYQSALMIEPENGEVHFNYGNLLETIGQKEEAKKHFLMAGRLLPNNPTVKAKLSTLK